MSEKFVLSRRLNKKVIFTPVQCISQLENRINKKVRKQNKKEVE